MTTTKTGLRAAFMATSALMLSAGLAAAEDYTRFGIKQDVPGPCSFAAIDAKDYSGRTLNIITHAIPVIGEPTALHARQFQELTGATVNVVHVPFGDLFQRIMIPFQTGQAAYDVLFFGSLWLGDFHPYLAEVPAAYQETPGMRAVTPTYRGVATWNGRMLNYTMDGDRHYLPLPEIPRRCLCQPRHAGAVPGTHRPRPHGARDLGGIQRGRRGLQQYRLGRRRGAELRHRRGDQARRSDVLGLHQPGGPLRQASRGEGRLLLRPRDHDTPGQHARLGAGA
jgi:hypothetical protein